MIPSTLQTRRAPMASPRSSCRRSTASTTRRSRPHPAPGVSRRGFVAHSFEPDFCPESGAAADFSDLCAVPWTVVLLECRRERRYATLSQTDHTYNIFCIWLAQLSLISNECGVCGCGVAKSSRNTLSGYLKSSRDPFESRDPLPEATLLRDATLGNSLETS